MSDSTAFLEPKEVTKIGTKREIIPFPSGEAELYFNPFANRFGVNC